MLRQVARRSSLFHPRGVQQVPIRTCTQITNPIAVKVANNIEKFGTSRALFGLACLGVATIFTCKYYSHLQTNEYERSRVLASGYERSVGSILLSKPVSILSPATILNAPLPNSVAIHLLLLYTISNGSDINTLQNILQKYIPSLDSLSNESKSKLAEIMLISINSGVLHPNNIQEIPEQIGYSYLQLLRVLSEKLPSDAKITKSNHRSVSGAISKLLQQQPAVAQSILAHFGLKELAALSEARKDDKIFYAAILQVLAEVANEQPDMLLNDEFSLFLKNALSNQKPPEPLASATATQYAKFRYEDDKAQSEAAQKVYLEAARCLGNISYQKPYETQRLVDQGALYVLRTASNEARNRYTILHIARAIANLSVLEENKIQITEEGWVLVLQHWVSTECLRSITFSQTQTSDTLNVLSKNMMLEEFHQSEKFLWQKKDPSKALSVISLVALTNLSLNHVKNRERNVQGFFLRDIMAAYRVEDVHNQALQQNIARFLATLACGNDSNVNKRIITHVGVEGLVDLLQNADVSIKYDIARTMAHLSNERIMAKQIAETLRSNPSIFLQLAKEEDSSLIDKIAETLLVSPSAFTGKIPDNNSLLIKQQLAQTMINVALIGNQKLNRIPEVISLLETWTKSSDKVLSALAFNALEIQRDSSAKPIYISTNSDICYGCTVPDITYLVRKF